MGIGIPKNDLPTLFKKYMQVGADTTRKYDGTGLGLAICKQMAHGRSSQCFQPRAPWIYIYIYTTIQGFTCNSLEIPKSMLKPKILLVEDNKINVMVTQSMMKQLANTINVVNNGVEAVRVVQSCTYDLVLMDVCMPVMDGLQATRLIRSFEETGNWDAAVKAGIEQFVPPNDQKFNSSKRGCPSLLKCREVITKKRKEKKRMVKFETSPMNVILKDKIYAHLTFANGSKRIGRECR
ncbi:unnamed protein product [Camellia sinensis]